MSTACVLAVPQFLPGALDTDYRIGLRIIRDVTGRFPRDCTNHRVDSFRLDGTCRLPHAASPTGKSSENQMGSREAWAGRGLWSLQRLPGSHTL